jgi:hypothetical protein
VLCKLKSTPYSSSSKSRQFHLNSPPKGRKREGKREIKERKRKERKENPPF